jgi:hypothetical protein
MRISPARTARDRAGFILLRSIVDPVLPCDISSFFPRCGAPASLPNCVMIEPCNLVGQIYLADTGAPNHVALILGSPSLVPEHTYA